MIERFSVLFRELIVILGVLNSPNMFHMVKQRKLIRLRQLVGLAWPLGGCLASSGGIRSGGSL